MKRAFTLAETVMVITVLGFLFGITVLNISKITPDNDKAKFKKAYANIESAVSRLINDKALYPNSDGFLNTSPVILQVTGETIGFNGSSSKFREAMQYQLNVVKNKINCEMYSGTFSSTQCFMNEDGVVYGIPDTDFSTTGVIDHADLGKVVPIVLYTNWREGETRKVDNDAFIVGVRYDGNIRILYTVNCKKNPDNMQCRSAEYLQSDTIKLNR